MKKKLLAAILATTVATPITAYAGAKIKIDDDSDINLGFRLQSFYLNNDPSLVSPRDKNQFRVRRARLRLGANVTKWVSMFIQTEFAAGPGGGADMRVIDAFVNIHPMKWAQIVAGEHMAPAARQNLTSSGGLMAWDRPTQQSKVLTWGTRSTGSLTTRAIPGTSAGLVGDVDVRDQGFTFFGTGSFSETMHGKYYIGAYQGATTSGSNKRITGRLQANFLDAEPGYFNLSTYLGKKKTVGIGGSFDFQDKVAFDGAVAGKEVDYKWYTVDLFADYPIGPGQATGEFAWNKLDLDDADFLVANPALVTTGTGSSNPALGDATGKATQGDGFYIQGGYHMTNTFGLPGTGWQPWFLYEQWNADGVNDAGKYDAYRLGLSYFIKGHNANVKVAYEKVKPDAPGARDIDTWGVGFFVTY